jgi:hypothetical protein
MPVLIIIVIIVVLADVEKPVGPEPVWLMNLKIKTY